MIRYSKIEEKQKREIVLLIARPCFWGKCSFCDYIEDNSTDQEFMIRKNHEVLEKVTGEFGKLEVIDSASVFELPKKTLEEIREICKKKNIKTLIFEAHYAYKNRLNEIREFFSGIEVLFKIGIETFDYDFRENVLNKNAKFKEAEEVEKYFDAPCIMVGIKGQTKEMIRRDIDIIENHFKWATVNIFQENSTEIKRDDELIAWFMKEYSYLIYDPRIDFLYTINDFGIG